MEAEICGGYGSLCFRTQHYSSNGGMGRRGKAITLPQSKVSDPYAQEYCLATLANLYSSGAGQVGSAKQ